MHPARMYHYYTWWYGWEAYKWRKNKHLRGAGPSRIRLSLRLVDWIVCMNCKCCILYHFDQVFTILEILVSEKADKFSFELRRILKRSVFSAVTRD
jgi:hypothetical protein